MMIPVVDVVRMEIYTELNHSPPIAPLGLSVENLGFAPLQAALQNLHLVRVPIESSTLQPEANEAADEMVVNEADSVS